MKKLAAICALAFGLGVVGFVGGTASADGNCSAELSACLGVDDAGYVVVLDGNSGNPDPSDGYVGVSTANGLECSADGGPYNDDGSINTSHAGQACNPAD